MTVTTGKLIEVARKNRRITGEQLGNEVGESKSNISKMENDQVKNGIDRETLIRISKSLQAPNILLHYCQTCPIRKHIVLKNYPRLNNIKDDPAIIASCLQEEMTEGATAAGMLFKLLSKPNYGSEQDAEAFFVHMEQLVDAVRAYEELVFSLMIKKIHSKEDLDRVHEIQQAKMVSRGYHNPETEPAEPAGSHEQQHHKCVERGHHVLDQEK